MHIRTVDFNSILLRVIGLVALLSIPFRHLPRGVDDLFPFHTALTTNYSSLVLGISLFFIASQLARKKRSAYWLALFGTAALIVAELIHFRNPLQLILYSGALVNIYKDRSLYVVRSDGQSLKRASLTAASTLLVVLLFSILVMSRTDRRDFGKDLSTIETSSVIGRSLFNLPLPASISVRQSGERIVDLLKLTGISTVALIGFNLFQPLKLRRPPPKSHIRKARQILESYSQSTEDYLKLWPADKHYYFYHDSFVAFQVKNGIALILGGVTGKPTDKGRLRSAFVDYAHANGWRIAVIHANGVEAKKWEAHGLQPMFIGSEAAVESLEFATTTSKNKHFRYVRNKALKENLDFSFWQPPHSAERMSQLRGVSDAWLDQGKREYRFIMGYFDETYLNQSTVGLLQRNGEVVAYANLLPGFLNGKDSIDHMRYKAGLSSVAMHFLLMRLIQIRHEQGSTELNLGLAPLSQLEDQSLSNLNERLLSAIKIVGSRYYSFSGLEQFKGKFRPEWEARYIVYEGGLTKLPATLAALTAATNYKSKFIGRRPAELETLEPS